MAADVLEKIVAEKRSELARRQSSMPVQDLRRQLAGVEAPRGFARSLLQRMVAKQPAVIAEIKKASPSRGVIRENFDPRSIAIGYEVHGATCLSVLTDEPFFQGHDRYLAEARSGTGLPVLRKDFTIDAYQVFEARALGADCILLIVSILDDRLLRELHDLAVNLGMDVLVEVHDRQELERALAIDPGLIGINNRNLRTFETSLETTIELMASVPDSSQIVTESGIHTRQDVSRMLSAGIYGFLVGEAFMRADDPGRALAELFG